MGKPTPHYLPAAFIGGFGIRRPRLRESLVLVRFLDKPDKTERRRAESIAKEAGVYELQNPPPNVDPNIIDKIWDFYEPKLPVAVSAFESGTWTASDWGVVAFHVAAQGVRNKHTERATSPVGRLAISSRDSANGELALRRQRQGLRTRDRPEWSGGSVLSALG